MNIKLKNLKNKNFIIGVLILLLAILVSSNYEEITGKFFHIPPPPYLMIENPESGVYNSDVTTTFSVILFYDQTPATQPPITEFKVTKNGVTYNIPPNDLVIQNYYNTQTPTPFIQPYARKIKLHHQQYFNTIINIWGTNAVPGQNTLNVEVKTPYTQQNNLPPYTSTTTYTLIQ